MLHNRPPEPGRVIELAQSVARVTRLGFVQTCRAPSGADYGELAIQDRRRFRTIYADGLLILAAQQRLLDWLSEQTSKVGDPASARHHFGRVATNLRLFRNRWWLKKYTRWHQPDRLLRAMQEEIGLDKNYADLKEDHEFFAEIAQATDTTFFNRTLLALTFFSIMSCVASVLSLFGDNFHTAAVRAWALVSSAALFGGVTYYLLMRSGLSLRRSSSRFKGTRK
jgi:hypothetical protein